MKKYKMHLMILLVFALFVCGCGKTKKEEKKVEKKDITIYEQLEVKKEPLEEDDSTKVEEGITEWASAFLFVNSDLKDKEVIDKVLYSAVTNMEQKKNLIYDRTELYKDSTVTFDEIQTEVTKSNKADFKGKEVGVIECNITAVGMRNEVGFERIYTIELVVDYKTDIVSVYEVKSITWK
ncbi:MAG: hypothetical protein Q4C84_15425 [Bacillota bacterium]|nr:hypothetical protein [Bacillota bacterium]